MIILTGATCPLCAQLADEMRALHAAVTHAVALRSGSLVPLSELPEDLGNRVIAWHEARVRHFGEHGQN